ncbi:hypothetical protein M231_04023 [Tremella mesenterica]|uniref:Metaxin glutathione S-transferase domain-containing protein n=1 Tax=Tremella mesenterica TaxID=5217 RepID=A0A4Q1BLP1_TREME|nr:hypothetical protein M231_04023 [Tremella mesenterica]
MTTADVPDQLPSSSPQSIWAAPTWIKSFYAKFPLVVLDQEDSITWQTSSNSSSLWIHPPSSKSHPHHRSWASSHPISLRTQLLFLLRDPPVEVTFRPWTNAASAPGGTLPTLRLPKENRLVATDDIRSWLDLNHPLKGKAKEWNGVPSQEKYDKALAIAQVVLGPLHRAYLASLPFQPVSWHLSFPSPPELLAGLTTPLPATFTGDARDIDKESVVREGVEAIQALAVFIGDNWALEAEHATPLDALLVGYLYPIYSLEENSILRTALTRHLGLGRYADRVLDLASSNVR